MFFSSYFKERGYETATAPRLNRTTSTNMRVFLVCILEGYISFVFFSFFFIKKNAVIAPSEEDSTTFTIHTPENEIFKLRGKADYVLTKKCRETFYK